MASYKGKIPNLKKDKKTGKYSFTATKTHPVTKKVVLDGVVLKHKKKPIKRIKK